MIYIPIQYNYTKSINQTPTGRKVRNIMWYQGLMLLSSCCHPTQWFFHGTVLNKGLRETGGQRPRQPMSTRRDSGACLRQSQRFWRMVKWWFILDKHWLMRICTSLHRSVAWIRCTASRLVVGICSTRRPRRGQDTLVQPARPIVFQASTLPWPHCFRVNWPTSKWLKTTKIHKLGEFLTNHLCFFCAYATWIWVAILWYNVARWRTSWVRSASTCRTELSLFLALLDLSRGFPVWIALPSGS